MAQLVCQLRTVARNVFQHHLEDQAGHWIQVAGERLAAHAQRFQRNRAAARKWIHYQGRFSAMRCFHQSATRLQIGRGGGQVPVGEVRDELEQNAPQSFVRLDGVRPSPWPSVHAEQNASRLVLERRRTVRVAWIRQQERHQHRPRGRQRPSCPPRM